MAGSGHGRRFSRGRKFIFLFAAATLFGSSLILYLQTSHAFSHVIVPLVQKYVPGHIDVEQGSITFPAMIELTGLSYQNEEAGLSVRINRLVLRLSATPLLWNRDFLVEDLTLERSEVRFEPKPAPPGQEIPAASPSGHDDVLLLPLGVRRMQVIDSAVSIKTEDSEFTAQNTNLSVKEINPGRSGTVEMRNDMTVHILSNQTRWAGGVSLIGTIEQSPDSHQITWNGTNEVALREWPFEGLAVGSEPITLLHLLSGSYAVAAATVRHDSALTIDQGNTHLGKLSLGLTQTETSSGAVTDIALVVQEITADALNLSMVGERPLRLHANHLGGHVNLHAEGEQYRINSSISGKQLQVVTDNDATPPLDLDVFQAGAFDGGSGRLILDRFQLLVAGNGQPRLSGELRRPLTILVGPETSQREDALAPSNSQGEGAITIHKFDVPEVRQWLHIFGLTRLQGVNTGQFKGRVAISSRNKGRAIDVNGNLTISDVVLDASEHGAAQGPMTFAHEFHETVRDLTMLELKSLTITGAVNNRMKGAITLSGTIDFKDPMAHPSLKGSLGLAELPGEMLNPVLARWTDTRIAHSQLNGTAHVEVTGESVAWQIQLGGRQLALRLPKSRETTIPLDVDLSQRGNLDWKAGILQLDEATVRVFERSRPVITAALNKPVRLPLPGGGGRSDEASSRQSTGRLQSGNRPPRILSA